MEADRREARPTVAVVGSSLLLEGIAAKLAGSQEISVTYADLGTEEADEWLTSTWPAIVIFEIDSLNADHFLERLAAPQPPILIGLDFASNRIVVANEQEYIAPSINDLCSIVLESIRHRGDSKEGSMGETTSSMPLHH